MSRDATPQHHDQRVTSRNEHSHQHHHEHHHELHQHTSEPATPRKPRARTHTDTNSGNPVTTTNDTSSTGRPDTTSTNTPPTSTTSSTTTPPPSKVTTARPESMPPTITHNLWTTQDIETLVRSAGRVSRPWVLPSANGEHTQVVKDSARPNRQNLRPLWKTASVPHSPAYPCRITGCPNLRPCPTHPDPKPWAESKARRKTNGLTLSSSAEARRRTKILRTHRYTCHVCGQPLADEVDHVIPLAEGGPDHESNLRPIHRVPCHAAKTAAERRRGLDRRRSR